MEYERNLPESHQTSVLFYSSMLNREGKIIQDVIEELLPSGQVAICRSPVDLSHRLQELQKNLPILIILISTKDELIDVLSFRNLLFGFRLILILPDSEEETVALGHRLRPNFLTYLYSNAKEIKAVLEKMLKNT
jgi:hypothetical protein